MAIPSSLACEWRKVRQQEPGTRLWWALRVAITAGLLNGPLLGVVRGLGGWGFLLFTLLLSAALLLWWGAARLYATERRRIEQKVSSGWFAGWRGAMPMIFAVSGFLIGLRPSTFLQTSVQPFVVFAIIVFVMEQSLAAKGASFDLLAAREDALRAKLAPHFIFNTLNTLHAQIEHDPRSAQLTTERLAEVFRQVIAASDQPTIPLKQELAFVEAYLAIEQARLGGRLRVVVDVPEELESESIPPLSLQVLVENAIKHGVAPLERGGTVRIGAERADDGLRLWVEDPGNGLSPLKGTGTALETLRQRLDKPEDLTMAQVNGRHRVGFRWGLA